MFRLRIHSVESPHLQGHSAAVAGEAQREAAATTSSSSSSSSPVPTLTPPRNPSPNPNNPRIQLLRGVIHLYRCSSSPSAAASSSSSSNPHLSPESLLPAGRGTLLFVLAVPSHLSPEDFLRFCGSYVERFSEIRVIRNDAMEDRYSVLVGFDDQKNADGFYLDLNGWRFTSAEGEVCHILFVASVEFTESIEIAATPPVGSTELPTCPVCIERLDQDISGIVATTCDHSFQCSCISKWVNSSCSVCQFCQEHSEKPTCSICGTSENLWICVICGFAGCGRYKEGHAIRHWKDTQHCYSLDLEAQQVWDYVGDSYVHRLNQSKSDDNLAKLKSNCRSLGDKCVSCTCSDDSGISGALFCSNVEAIVDEYNNLLASQLENQKQYYETLLQEAKQKREKYISEAVEKAVNSRLQDIQLKLENVIREKKVVAEMNENLMKNQNLWREKIKEIEERERTTLKLKDERIHELEEEIRDFTVCIEAQKALDSMVGADEIRGGTVLPVPSPQPSSTRNKRSSKLNRRRN